jgi:hypothetical protein
MWTGRVNGLPPHPLEEKRAPTLIVSWTERRQARFVSWALVGAKFRISK